MRKEAYILLHVQAIRNDVIYLDGPFENGTYAWNSSLPNAEEIAALVNEGALLWDALPEDQKIY